MYSNRKKRNYKMGSPLAISFFIMLAINLSLIPSSVYAESSGIKWQPGHYMRFKSYHSESNMRQFLSNQYTKGLTILIPWRDLEPQINNYNFEKLDNFLSLVSNYNKYLMLDIEVKCFNTSCTHGNVPNYLRSGSSYNGGVELLTKTDGTVKGSTARVWDTAVVDRLIKLLEAIGNKYDNNPNFVGVSLPTESAIALEKNTGGYNPEVYETQLIRIASAMSSAMPRTMGLIGMNFFPRGNSEAAFSRIAEHLVTTGQGGITHPDTVPGESIPSYKTESEYNDKLAIVPQFQTWNITHETSEEDIFLFATKTLGAQFVVWNHQFSSKYGGARLDYIASFVLPVVNKYKGQTAGDFPKSFAESTPTPSKLRAPELSILVSE